MTAAIECVDLVKTYPGRPPVEAVRGIDLQIERGECFGVLGPNGAGKTTTIEMLEGLLSVTSGSIHILGLEWNRDGDAIRQRIGISLQETKLSEKLSVLETVTLFRSFYRSGLTPLQAIGAVSLEPKSAAWIKTLSGGQKQRLAVACALVGDPDLLFLDEPTTGLDPQSRRQLWEIIRQNRDQGKTVMLTTHYMEEAERLCDRVAIVDAGQVIALGSPANLIAEVAGEHIIEITALGLTAQGLTGQGLTGQGLTGQGLTGQVLAEQLIAAALPTVDDVRTENERVFLSVRQPHAAIPALLDYLRQQQTELTSLTTRHASLEDVFVKLTGRHLDDEGEPSV